MTIDKGQANTRERVLSSDWNRQTELGNRAISEALSASVSGYARETGILGDTSFLVTPLNGTMKSAIAPGLALYYDSTQVYPKSTMVWVESREVREVTHPVADALARWDVVEMQPGELISSTQPRDQFDPLTGTFTVVNMTKEIKSYPTFQVRSGTPSASPAVPAGTPGWIPLAYVQVLGAAVTVDQTKIVHCRPLLGSRQIDREGYSTSALANVYAVDVKGGGVEWPGGDIDNGALVNSMEGRFAGHHHKFRLTKTCPIKIATMNWDGGGLPAVNSVVYFYAVPAPYPSGYDANLAKRELWTPDPDNLYGDNGGYYDSNFQHGCLIVASTSEPDLTHPAGPSTGTGALQHEFFADAGLVPSTRSQWVYIGAAFYDNATTEVVEQRVVGRWVAPSRKTGAVFQTLLPIAAPTVFNMWSGFTGADFTLPVTARRLSMQVFARLGAEDALFIEMEDDWTGGGAVGQDGAIYFTMYNPDPVNVQNESRIFEVTVNATGELNVQEATVIGVVNTGRFVARAYRDAVLEIR